MEDCKELDILSIATDERHPYDLPLFVATVASASKAYADWVRVEVQLP